jgi:hypothetical protein
MLVGSLSRISHNNDNITISENRHTCVVATEVVAGAEPEVEDVVIVVAVVALVVLDVGALGLLTVPE